MTNPHGEFIWYELMTPDPGRAKAFYEEVVGWTIDADPLPGIDYHMIRASDGFAGGILKRSADDSAGGARPGWIGYFGVDDVDAASAAIVSDGGHQHMSPTDIPNVGRLAMLSDPQGALFYIMRGASAERSIAYQRMGMGHVSWNELLTTDDAAALTFYERHFNIGKIGAMPMGEMGDYSFISNDGKSGQDDAIGAVMRVPPGAPMGWNFYFRVPDIEIARSRVEAGGGTLISGPMEVPGGEQVLQAMDPDGVIFGLVAPKQGAGT